jgi:FkbM family methyltransferase
VRTNPVSGRRVIASTNAQNREGRLRNVTSSRVWPRHIFPGPRSLVVSCLAEGQRLGRRLQRLVRNRVAFPVWRAISRFRHGDIAQVNAHGYSLWVRTDDLRSYWISREHGTQPTLIAAWQSLLDLAPALAVDVGANYGEFSVHAAGTVPLLSVEANPAVYQLLDKNLQGYSEVVSVNAAASDHCGEMSLYMPCGYTGGSSLSADVVSGIGARHIPRSRPVKEEKIQVLTLDDMLTGRHPASVILKIDVEGFEREVLDGAVNILRRARWWRAIVEFDAATLERRNVSVEDTWAQFARYWGMVITTTPVSEGWLERPSSRIPAEPIARANLLLGEGVAVKE